MTINTKAMMQKLIDEAQENAFGYDHKITNPKDNYGIKKCPLELIPDTALIHTAMAFKEGALKYGAYNWRTNEVKTSIYIGAARRHIAQYWNGEQYDAESNVHNLACAIACLSIIIDAEECNNIIKDLPTPVDITSLLNKLKSE